MLSFQILKVEIQSKSYPLPFNGDEMLDYKEKLAIICLVLHEGMLIQNTIDVSFVWLSTLSG